jgi:hypothetical protein
MLTLTNLSRAESIVEYGAGSKIRVILDDSRIKEYWVKETPEEICEMVNALNKKYNHSVSIYWKESKVFLFFIIKWKKENVKRN